MSTGRRGSGLEQERFKLFVHGGDPCFAGGTFPYSVKCEAEAFEDWVLMSLLTSWNELYIGSHDQ